MKWLTRINPLVSELNACSDLREIRIEMRAAKEQTHLYYVQHFEYHTACYTHVKFGSKGLYAIF
jgi:hypothetical protein